MTPSFYFDIHVSTATIWRGAMLRKALKLLALVTAILTFPI
jgi:hypothetical protein